MAGAFTGPTEDVTGRYAEVQPLNVALSSYLAHRMTRSK